MSMLTNKKKRTQRVRFKIKRKDNLRAITGEKRIKIMVQELCSKFPIYTNVFN